MSYVPDPEGTLVLPRPSDPHPEQYWQRQSPTESGFEEKQLSEAVDFARTHAAAPTDVTFDFSGHEERHRARGDHWQLIGPMPDRRAGANGMILKDGYLVAEWGDTRYVDHAFSVAKSFLSMLAGVAVDRGMIGDVSNRVSDTIDHEAFDSAHNRAITWEHLLTQTSEWKGSLFGIPDTVDRNRSIGRSATDSEQFTATGDRHPPGSHWEYNDVRINCLALALLHVWKKPLPAVLSHEIMQPIGASDRWEWHGYYNSTVEVEGRRMKSVAGGGHWGGGLWISSHDLARVGLLLLSGGKWGGQSLLAPDWIDAAARPSDVKENYGYLFWLNTENRLCSTAPTECFAAIGLGGTNLLWVDPVSDLVVVNRWLQKAPDDTETPFYPVIDSYLQRIYTALS